MMTIKKSKLWELIILTVLFLFSISLFNMAGYIYAAMIVILIITNGNRIRISRCEILLIIFSGFFFAFYSYHYGIDIQLIILYLFGPWTAYIIGKMFVERTKDDNSFQSLIIVLSMGMWLHGILNWITYMRSEHFETYKYYRRSVDVWRGELVNVNTTGMLYTFATGISIGIIFSNVAKKYKITAAGVLGLSVGASIFFANRTLLVVIAIILVIKGFSWILAKDIKAKTKVAVILMCFVVIAFALISVVLNLGGIGDWLFSLKIIQRFLSDNESLRFDVWGYFVKDMNFIRHPLGGGYMLHDAPFSYFHNLWLDVYNTTGVIPFIVLIIFAIYMVERFRRFRNTMLKNNLKNDYVIFQCLMIAIILNCMVEPIMEADSYYFLSIMMCLGAMEGKTRKEIRTNNYGK